MKKSTLILLASLVTVMALLCYFAAMLSMAKSGMYGTGMTPAEWVHHFYPLHLVPRDWIGSPSDSLSEATGKWWLAEIRVRRAAVFFVWLFAIAMIVRYYFRHRRHENAACQVTA